MSNYLTPGTTANGEISDFGRKSAVALRSLSGSVFVTKRRVGGYAPLVIIPSKISLSGALFIYQQGLSINYLVFELNSNIFVKFGGTSTLRPTRTSKFKRQVDIVKGDIAPL